MKQKENNKLRTGLVIRKTAHGYLIKTNDEEVLCTLSGKMRPGGRNMENGDGTPVTGDLVTYKPGHPGSGVIEAVLPRRNRFSRRSPVPMPGAQPHEQVFAANLDQVVPVFAAAQPEPKWNLLDRFLAAAEAADIPSLVCISKTDLGTSPDGGLSEDLAAAVERYRATGYPVVLFSAITGEGLGNVGSALQGKRSLLVGKSGVGKSSLVNALVPQLALETNEVNPVIDKGRHTTSHQQMYTLPGGGEIIDSPGIREFGLWDVYADELADCFPEMRPSLGRCKFGADCLHDEEPGCAVRTAVMQGQIDPLRYRSYLLMMEELP